jgi:hypothetical protein
MSHARGFNNIGIHTARFVTQNRLLIEQFLGHSAANLCDLERVSESVVKDMALVRGKNLGDSRKPSESGREQYPVTITLSFGSIVGWTIQIAETIITIRRFGRTYAQDLLRSKAFRLHVLHAAFGQQKALVDFEI